MKIFPLPGIIQIHLEEARAGVLDTSSRNSAVEYAEVLAVGEAEFEDNSSSTLTASQLKLIKYKPVLKKGDKVFVKSWAIDIISHDGKKYYFVNPETKGILAIIR